MDGIPSQINSLYNTTARKWTDIVSTTKVDRTYFVLWFVAIGTIATSEVLLHDSVACSVSLDQVWKSLVKGTIAAVAAVLVFMTVSKFAPNWKSWPLVARLQEFGAPLCATIRPGAVHHTRSSIILPGPHNVLYKHVQHEVCARALDLQNISPVGNSAELRRRIVEMDSELISDSNTDDIAATSIGIVQLRDLLAKLKQAVPGTADEPGNTESLPALRREGRELYSIVTPNSATIMTRIDHIVMDHAMNVLCGAVEWGSEDAKAMILRNPTERFLAHDTAKLIWFVIGAQEANLEADKWFRFSRGVQFVILSRSTLWPANATPYMYVRAGSTEARSLIDALGAYSREYNSEITFLPRHKDVDAEGLDEWFYRNPDSICDPTGASWYNMGGRKGIHPGKVKNKDYHNFLYNMWGIREPESVAVTLKKASVVRSNIMEQERSRRQINAAADRIRGIRNDTEIGAELIAAFQLPPRDIANQMSSDPTFLTKYQPRWDKLKRIGIDIEAEGSSDYINDVGTFLTGTQVYSRLASRDARNILAEVHTTTTGAGGEEISPDATKNLEPLPVADGTELAEHPLFQRVLMLMGAALGKRRPVRNFTGETVGLQFADGANGADYQIPVNARVGQNFEIFGGDSVLRHIFTVVPADYVEHMEKDGWQLGKIVPGASGDDVPDALKTMSVDDISVVVMGKLVDDDGTMSEQWLHGCYWNADMETRAHMRQLMKVATKTIDNPHQPTLAHVASRFVLRRLMKEPVAWPSGTRVILTTHGDPSLYNDTPVSSYALGQVGIVDTINNDTATVGYLTVFKGPKSMIDENVNRGVGDEKGNESVVVKLQIDTLVLTRAKAAGEAPWEQVTKIWHAGPRMMRSKQSVVDPMTYGPNTTIRNAADPIARNFGGQKWSGDVWYNGGVAIIRCIIEPKVKKDASPEETRQRLDEWKERCRPKLRSDVVAMIIDRISARDQANNTPVQLLADSVDGNEHGNPTIEGRMTSQEAQRAMTALQTEITDNFATMIASKGVIRGMVDWALKTVKGSFMADDEDSDLSAVVLGLSAAALDGLKTVSTVQSEGEIEYAGFDTREWYKNVFTQNSLFGTAATVSLVTSATFLPVTTAAAIGVGLGATAASRGWEGVKFIGQGLSNMGRSTFNAAQGLVGAVTGVVAPGAVAP